MKYFKYLILILFIFNFDSSNAKNKDLHIEITKNLRCLVCQGQSIYDSGSEFANSLKVIVKKKISEGMTEKQIYKFLSEKYGEWILYDTQLNKNTYFLWFLPLLIFLLGGAIIFNKLIIIKKNSN